MQWRWLEGDDFAARVRNAWQQGILRGASIGFLPKSSSPNKYGGRNFDAWELLEVSLCCIPSNPTAVRTLQKMGLWEETRGRKDVELEIDYTPAELKQKVEQITRGLLAEAHRKKNEEALDIDEATLRREIARIPVIVREAFIDYIRQQVDLGMRRAAGRLD